MGRRLREKGEILRLGDIDYRLEGVEGCGGSAVVYRASYEDRLNRGYFHQVLIKELYPFCEDDGIWRDSQGNICCAEEARERLDGCRRSFLAGNEANLRLLGQMPEQISGNLNSYEAYGTFYIWRKLRDNEKTRKSWSSDNRDPEENRKYRFLLHLTD